MKVWPILFIITLLLLVASNAYWFNSEIRNGYKLSFQKTQLDKKTKALETLRKLITKRNHPYTKQEVLQILRQDNSAAFIVDKGDTVDAVGVILVFADDKLSAIKE